MRSNNWTNEEISMLISMWSEREVQRIFDGKDNNTKAYARIDDRIKDAGLERSATQIQTKLNKLRQSFYKAKYAITMPNPDFAHTLRHWTLFWAQSQHHMTVCHAISWTMSAKWLCPDVRF